MTQIDLTQNIDLKIEADVDADNWCTISGFDLDQFAQNWKYEVSNHKGSALLMDLSNGDDLQIDTETGEVTLQIKANVLKAGTYYHKLYADTNDADKKFRFGGVNNLIIKQY